MARKRTPQKQIRNIQVVRRASAGAKKVGLGAAHGITLSFRSIFF